MASLSRLSQVKEIRNYEAWARQIWYWRTHLDVFIEDYFEIKLKDVQRVEARAFGNCDTIYFVQSRGFGKTWLTAVCCQAMGVLYPGSQIAVISGTAEQAKLVPKKIDDYFVRNENILREIDCSNGSRPVRINAAKGVCVLKNGSKIESFSIGTFRGNRAKIVVVDEAPEVKKEDLEAIAKPVLNTTRDNCVQLGIPDYPSKVISITSACLKSNYFFDAFVKTLQEMSKGSRDVFACALDYRAAIRCGISPASFFEKEKRDLSKEKFSMEYGSIFLGAEAGSVFPYELTEKCRILHGVETAMPAKSKAEYVMSIDLATSNKKAADNAVIVILKQVECEDGGYIKKLVNIRSFHGKRLDALATEVRRLLVKFPNVSKVVFDHRGLGDAFPQFLSQPWTDPETQKEYPPLVMDTEKSLIHNALPLLHPVIATNAVNQQMVSAVTIALEQGSLELPLPSRMILGNKIAQEDDEAAETGKKLTQTEKAIFIETDALQIEMGNIVAKETAAGSVIYDTAKHTQHKDRYSALAMGVQYVSAMEDYIKKRRQQAAQSQCIGVIVKF